MSTQARGECPGCKTPNTYTSVICTMCGARLPWADAVAPKPSATQTATPAPASPAPAKRSFFDLGNALGWARALIMIGAVWVLYFLLFFDTSVEIPVTEFMGTQIGGGRVNNIGLMAERQNYILVGMGMVILGVVIYFTNKPKTD